LSFNDKIVNYDYDQQSKKISFEIPFKYNMTRIEEGFIYIHMEIKIPETFHELFNAKEYLSTINNIEHDKISSASVSVDRFSNSSSVMVHFILDSNSLFKLTKERQEHSTEGTEMTLLFSLQPNKTTEDIKQRDIVMDTISFLNY
jgi:predicted SPOUT superfamily RNA methylase MTH1